MVAPSPPPLGGLEGARGLLRGQAGLLLPYVGRGTGDLVFPPCPVPRLLPRMWVTRLLALWKPGRPVEHPPGGAASRNPLARRPPLWPALRRGPTPWHGVGRGAAGSAPAVLSRWIGGGGRGDSPLRGRRAPGSCIFMSVMSEGEHSAW